MQKPDDALTMSSRERVTRALRFEHPDRAPRDLWVLPGIPMYRQSELDAMLKRYPTDFAFPDFKYGPATRAKGIPSQVGRYTDEWGCGWEVGEPGVVGEVKSPPLASWSDLAAYTPPFEILDNADFSRVNTSCANSEKFMLVWGTAIRPFERLQFLRGTEELFIDLAYGTREVMQLLEMLHEFFLRELSLWVETDVDGISFMDDWGAQDKLLISPAMWQALFKPLYAEYVNIIHNAGKFAFMHSDGHISAIYPDIVDIGVDALNSQLFCMDIESLAREFKGKITFWEKSTARI